MYLILLRHGQAEKATESGNDADRMLTETGRRAMCAFLDRTLPLLPLKGRITVWTSPLIRARQTADIVLSEAVKLSGKNRISEDSPVAVESLAASDVEGVLSVLAGHIGQHVFRRSGYEEEQKTEEGTENSAPQTGIETDGSDEEILFLVGHDPQISHLAEYLGGCAIRFRKGAIMCLRLEQDAVVQLEECEDASRVGELMAGCAQLQWFVQGPAFRRWKTLTDLEKLLKEGFGKVEENCGRFLEDAEDADCVHDLRISIRTLRSMVSFIEPFQKKRQNRRMQRDLREVVTQLSRLREYDVLIEKSKQVDIDLSPAEYGPKPPEKLDAVLNGMREQESELIRHEFTRRRFSGQLRQIRKEFRNIEWRSEVEKEGLSEDDLTERLGDMTDAFLGAYNCLDLSDAEETHEVRKEAKIVRYAANSMKALLGDRQDIVAGMKQIQDKLGALCDARVNAALLREISRSDGLSEIARWQAESLLAMEKEEERKIIEELREPGTERNSSE